MLPIGPETGSGHIKRVYLGDGVVMRSNRLIKSQFVRAALFIVLGLGVTSLAKADNITLASLRTAADAGQTNDAGSGTDPSTTVPEPGLALLMMVGLVGVGGASFLRKTGRPLEHRDPMNHDKDIPANFFAAPRTNTAPSNELDEFEIRRRAFFS